jgi:hypothetical protein
MRRKKRVAVRADTVTAAIPTRGEPMTTDRQGGECLTCATDASPGGIVWTRTTVPIDTLRRFAAEAETACCADHVDQGLREHADEPAVLVAATRITTAAADGTAGGAPDDDTGRTD